MLTQEGIYIKTIDFLIEEIKNIQREKSDLVAQIKLLEIDNNILKEKLAIKEKSNCENISN